MCFTADLRMLTRDRIKWRPEQLMTDFWRCVNVLQRSQMQGTSCDSGAADKEGAVGVLAHEHVLDGNLEKGNRGKGRTWRPARPR